MGVTSGADQLHEGHVATGTFDVVTALAPFLSPGARGATLGSGSAIGQARGLGPMAPMATRTGRLTLVEQNLQNFAPSPFGKRVGLGFSRAGAGPEGHAAVIVERPEGGFWFVEKNAAREPNGALVANFREAPEPLPFYERRTSRRPFEYDSVRVPKLSAADAMNYARNRTTTDPREPFDFNCANCSHFAGDVLAKGGFRGMGNGRASGLWSDFTNFNVAKRMAPMAPFWTRVPTGPALSK